MTSSRFSNAILRPCLAFRMSSRRCVASLSQLTNRFDIGATFHRGVGSTRALRLAIYESTPRLIKSHIIWLGECHWLALLSNLHENWLECISSMSGVARWSARYLTGWRAAGIPNYVRSRTHLLWYYATSCRWTHNPKRADDQ